MFLQEWPERKDRVGQVPEYMTLQAAQINGYWGWQWNTGLPGTRSHGMKPGTKKSADQIVVYSSVFMQWDSLMLQSYQCHSVEKQQNQWKISYSHKVLYGEVLNYIIMSPRWFKVYGDVLNYLLFPRSYQISKNNIAEESTFCPPGPRPNSISVPLFAGLSCVYHHPTLHVVNVFDSTTPTGSAFQAPTILCLKNLPHTSPLRFPLSP